MILARVLRHLISIIDLLELVSELSVCYLAFLKANLLQVLHVLVEALDLTFGVSLKTILFIRWYILSQIFKSI